MSYFTNRFVRNGDVTDTDRSSGWTSALLFGAKGDGVSDDTAALRRALATTTRLFVPRGTYVITGVLDLRSGQHIEGQGPQSTVFAKTDFAGPVFSGVDTNDVTLTGFSVKGPGRNSGNTPNKGVVVAVAQQPIVLNLSVSRVQFSELNDVCLYIGSGYGTRLEGVTCKQYGYCGFFVQGGDGSKLDSCSTIFGLVGFRIEALTTLVAAGCYAEQAGIGFQVAQSRCVTLQACGNEAPITFDGTFNGTGFQIDGGSGVSLDFCLSRQDTSGNPVNSPHVEVTNAAKQVRITGFHLVNHATPTTVEARITGASDVQLVQCNIDAAKTVN